MDCPDFLSEVICTAAFSMADIYQINHQERSFLDYMPAVFTSPKSPVKEQTQQTFQRCHNVTFWSQQHWKMTLSQRHSVDSATLSQLGNITLHFHLLTTKE